MVEDIHYRHVLLQLPVNFTELLKRLEALSCYLVKDVPACRAALDQVRVADSSLASY